MPPTTRRDFERVTPDTVAAARALPTATLHEAGGKIGALPSAIKPVAPSFRCCGPALTVHSPGGDNLWLHRALYIARPGDVLVVYVSGAYEHGYWGEIMTTMAKVRRLAGLVIDGCVRDGTLLEEIGFPVFARGLCIRGTGKDYGAIGWINEPVLIGDVTVSARRPRGRRRGRRGRGAARCKPPVWWRNPCAASATKRPSSSVCRRARARCRSTDSTEGTMIDNHGTRARPRHRRPLGHLHAAPSGSGEPPGAFGPRPLDGAGDHRRDPDVLVLRLRGQGRHFCSGFNIGQMDGEGGGAHAGARFEAIAEALERARPVTIAEIHGGVYGGATDLALACDFRLGSTAAEMQVPAARLGLLFYGGGMERLVPDWGCRRPSGCCSWPRS